jgi:hypothetical protein
MTTQWIRSNDVVWEDLDGEALLVRSSTGQRWTLNATAAGIWKLCDGGFDLSGLARRFSKVSRREIAEFVTYTANTGRHGVHIQPTDATDVPGSRLGKRPAPPALAARKQRTGINVMFR